MAERKLWERAPRTAGHPPPGTKQERSAPGAAAARLNEAGGVGREGKGMLAQYNAAAALADVFDGAGYAVNR